MYQKIKVTDNINIYCDYCQEDKHCKYFTSMYRRKDWNINNGLRLCGSCSRTIKKRNRIILLRNTSNTK